MGERGGKKRKNMKQEFEMTQEEMVNIIAINKGGGDPVMFLSGGTPMGSSLQEKINQYWEILGSKYGFKPMTVEGSSKGKLFFLAEPKPVIVPKTFAEIEMDKYIGESLGYMNNNVSDSLKKICEQLESAYSGDSKEISGDIGMNVAFMALKRMAK